MAPVERVKKKAGTPGGINFKVIGASGLRHSAGRIDMELTQRLRGDRAPKLFREMSDNEAVVGGFLYMIETWAKRAQWRIEPAIENDETAQEWADFIEECRQDMSHTWEEFLDECLSMCTYGWSLFEECYKYRSGESNDPTKNSKYTDGKIGWRKISKREQDTLDKWEFDEDDGIQGMYQRLPDSSSIEFLPIDKCLLFRTKNIANNPEGRSLLRSGIRSYLFLKRLQEIEAIGIERDLSGYPVMEVPEELFDGSTESDATLQEYKTIVTGVRRDELEGAVIPCELNDEGKPTGYKFRLMSTGGARAINIGDVIKRYESRIAVTVLAEFLLLGMDKVGSFSMHSSKVDAFAVALGALLDRISSIFNRYAIPRLCRVNGCPPEMYPRLVHGDLAPPPLDMVVQYVSGLASAGMLTPDPRLERKLREIADLPEMDESNYDTSPDLDPSILAQLPPDVRAKLTAAVPPVSADAPPADTPPETPAVPAVDGEASPAIPDTAAKPTGPGGETLSQVSLNGAQITAIKDLILSVANDELPRESVLAIITIAFPISRAQAEQMMGEVGLSWKVNKPNEPVPPALQQQPPPPPPVPPAGADQPKGKA